MNKEFIPYEQALELKELGFDEPCFGFFNITWTKTNELLFPQYAGELENWNNSQHLASAPLYQQAFRWFREKYNLPSNLELLSNGWDYVIYLDVTEEIDFNEGPFSTHEEAELACLIKLIEIVKGGNK